MAALIHDTAGKSRHLNSEHHNEHLNMACLFTKPDLGLVIPTFNRSRFLKEALLSALGQSIKFREIVVVDNGSTDDTPEMVHEFRDRISYIRIPKLGVQAARNAGVSHLNTEWVAFCDDDDLLLPNYVKSFDTATRRHSFDAICQNFVTFTESTISADKFSQAPDGWFEGSEQSDGIIFNFPELLARNLRFQPIFPTGLAVRKSVFDQLGGYDTKFLNVGSEDWQFTLRLIAKWRLALNCEVTAKIRKHSANTSRSVTRQLLGECHVLEQALINLKEMHPLANEVRDSIVSRRTQAFDALFSAGDFELAKSLAGIPGGISPNWKRYLKKMILKLPAEPRRKVWKLTTSNLNR